VSEARRDPLTSRRWLTSRSRLTSRRSREVVRNARIDATSRQTPIVKGQGASDVNVIAEERQEHKSERHGDARARVEGE
jgi:phage gp46-like protein